MVKLLYNPYLASYVVNGTATATATATDTACVWVTQTAHERVTLHPQPTNL